MMTIQSLTQERRDPVGRYRALSGRMQMLVSIAAFDALLSLRDYWLGVPLLAFCWLAAHVGGMANNLLLIAQHGPTSPGPLPHLTWPTWSLADLLSWYTPHVASQWARIWHNAAVRSEIRSGFMVIAIVLVAGLIKRQINSSSNVKLRPSIVHGSAHFAEWSEIRELRAPRIHTPARVAIAQALVELPTLPAPIAAKIAPARSWAHTEIARRPRGESYFPLGRYQGRAVALSMRLQEEMMLLIAPTGTRKTTTFVAPPILSEQGARSLYIPDMKPELWAVTSGHLATVYGAEHIWRFAPGDPETSMCYNPLAYITDSVSARQFATCFLSNTGGMHEKDSFWNNLAVSLIMGAISHLQATEPQAPLMRLIKWFTSMSLDDLQVMFENSPSVDAQERAHTLIGALRDNPKLAAGVMTDLVARWEFLKSDRVYRVTARNDLDFDQMARQPTVLFTTFTTQDTKSLSFLSACLVMNMFDHFVSVAESTGEMPCHCMCYMDEFTNQGMIPDFVSRLSTMRSRGVGMLIVAQSYAQIEAKYGKDGLQAIKENCNTHITLPGAGQEICVFLSERIGETTTLGNTASNAYTYSTDRAAASHNQGEGEHRRRLITADEIRTMPKGYALIVNSNLPAIVTRVRPWYETDLVVRGKLPPPRITAAPRLTEIPPAPSIPLAPPQAAREQPPEPKPRSRRKRGSGKGGAQPPNNLPPSPMED